MLRMALLLSKSSSKGIFKANEDSNVGYIDIECEINNISRRYFDKRISMQGAKKWMIHFDICSPDFGFSDQQKQICFTTMLGFTVYRCENKF